MNRAGVLALAITALVVTTASSAGVDARVVKGAARASASPGRVTTAEPITTLRVGIAHDGGYTVRQMGVEEYVAGVIAGEAARDSTPAALEALAIAVRTFAMANLGRHRGDKFDLCDTTHCQVLRKPTQATVHAAEATAGGILLDRGAPASIYFSASCGGHTERPSEVWPGAADPSYLPSKPDDACGGQPVWAADLTAGDLERALRSGGFKGRDLRDLRISARNDSGRVVRLSLDGFSPDAISGQDLRTVVGRTLGWQFIKSTSFELRRTSAGFHFSGRGSGHGVGMCVIGAAQLGARGRSAAEILSRYFPGLPISTRPVPSVTATVDDVIVMLPAGDEGERDVIRDLATRSRNDLAKRLGVDRPSRITLRFHPTVEAYQRATGQPWFTAGCDAERRDEFRAAHRAPRSWRPRSHCATRVGTADDEIGARRPSALGARRRGVVLRIRSGRRIGSRIPESQRVPDRSGADAPGLSGRVEPCQHSRDRLFRPPARGWEEVVRRQVVRAIWAPRRSARCRSSSVPPDIRRTAP